MYATYICFETKSDKEDVFEGTKGEYLYPKVIWGHIRVIKRSNREYFGQILEPISNSEFKGYQV